ncbi:MAG TPA: hypothetical protein VF204_02645, partial [Streptosporangiaceae bacterium]
TRGPVQACAGPDPGPGAGSGSGPGAPGGRNGGRGGRPDLTGYLHRLCAAAAADPVLAAALLRVASLVNPPGELFTDEIRSRVRDGGSAAVS